MHQLRNKRSLEKKKKNEIKLYHTGGVLPYHYPREDNHRNNLLLSASLLFKSKSTNCTERDHDSVVY